ncbi:DinB family protein [Arthrobacter sp. AFG20]|uniref:DinB family protein n=1 Tax=Arthrobacter sp. AFG20 TaxID=1688671 RepID=UPI000C9E9B12|nr:DinB family protein [Arthrobacter sp. AFG20]PNH82904.1 maleylpyruvate isomerase [Arthrobacter sp. AFG20]
MEPTKNDILAGYSRARTDLDYWLAEASTQELHGKSNGTKWANEELLFHMVFGYMVLRALLPLVHLVSRLPAPIGKAFAALLNAGTRPFDVINYWGSKSAALYFNKQRMARKLDKTINAITRSLKRESPASLSRSMAFPDRWDPFFAPSMTLNDVYAYPTKHFDFHAGQLSLRRPQR